MAFLITTRLLRRPKPTAQGHSDVGAAGTAASTATHLAANQASALPRESRNADGKAAFSLLGTQLPSTKGVD